MGAKYTCNYRDSFDQQCRIEIEPASGYSGDTIIVKSRSQSACTISWDADDDPYENPIVNSKASISLIQQGKIDIREIQEASDRDFIVSLFISGVLKWKGFLIPDGVQQLFQSEPFELNLTATDGLMLLDGIDYSHDNLQGGRCLVNYFRRILFASENLGLDLPLVWVSSLTNLEFPLEPDALSGSVTWSPRGEGFTDYNGNYKSCLYILTELARSVQARLFQSDGKWYLERINDVVSGSFTYRQIIGLNGFNITSGTFNVLKTIAGKPNTPDYAVVDSDHLLTVLPPLKRVTTTYEHEQRQNILPNGNMDIVETIYNKPLYWFASGATIQSVPSLSEAKGSAVEVINNSQSGGYLFAPRPPQSIPESMPGNDVKRYRLRYYFKGTAKTGDKIFMTDRDLDGNDVNTYSYTVPSTYNNDTDGALRNMAVTVSGFFTTPTVTYIPEREEWEFEWVANIKRVSGEQTITTVSLSSFSFDGYLPIDTDILYETINIGFKFVILNGYVLNEFGNINWNSTPNQIRVTYQRGTTTFYLNEFGFWVDQPTNIQINVANLKPFDVAQVDFNARQDIKMPLPDVTPIERTNPPQIKIEFLIPSGRRIQFDDIYMNVADNNNVTRGTYGNNTNTKSNDYTLKISSAHSGFYVSNFMTNYSQSGVQKFWKDSVIEGTLTDINTHAILRNRYKSSLMFDGSIYGSKFSYGEMYNIGTINGKNFLPLKAEWNTESNKIKINCLEVRNDNINIQLEQYGTSDNGSN